MESVSTLRQIDRLLLKLDIAEAVYAANVGTSGAKKGPQYYEKFISRNVRALRELQKEKEEKPKPKKTAFDELKAGVSGNDKRGEAGEAKNPKTAFDVLRGSAV